MAYVCKAFHGTNPFSERVGIFKVLIRLYICVRFVRKGCIISEDGKGQLISKGFLVFSVLPKNEREIFAPVG